MAFISLRWLTSPFHQPFGQIELSLDAFALLLPRIDWPLRHVRLQAALALGKLLSGPGAAPLRPRFLEWLSGRTLETEVVNGLSALTLSPVPPFTLAELLGAVRRPSLLADLYLQRLFGTRPRIVSWLSATSGRPPVGFQPRDSFEERLGSLAAPIFRTDLLHWERETGLPLLKQWAWEWQNLIDTTTYASPSPRHFMDWTIGDFQGDFEFREGEIYKSSYLRTLHYATREWNMPDRIGRQLALLAAPINPDLALVAAAPRPECIPVLASDDEVDEAVSDDGLLLALSHLRYNEEEMLLFASAPLYQSSRRWLEFDVVAGWVDSNLRDATEDQIDALSPLWAPQHDELLCLRSPLPPLRADDCATLWSRRGALPAALQPHPEAWGRWQTGLLLRGVFFPMPLGANGPIELVRGENYLAFEIAGEQVGRWTWWHGAWSPGFPSGANSSIGSALIVRRKLVDQWSRAMKSPPRRLVRLRRLWRSNDYENYSSDPAIVVWLG